MHSRAKIFQNKNSDQNMEKHGEVAFSLYAPQNWNKVPEICSWNTKFLYIKTENPPVKEFLVKHQSTFWCCVGESWLSWLFSRWNTLCTCTYFCPNHSVLHLGFKQPSKYLTKSSDQHEPHRLFGFATRMESFLSGTKVSLASRTPLFFDMQKLGRRVHPASNLMLLPVTAGDNASV